MNFMEKAKFYREVKSLFNSSYPEGCIKITSNESPIHAQVKTLVALYFQKMDYEVFSEVNLKDLTGRCDLVVISIKHATAYIVEIVNSESKESIERKKSEYPLEVIFVDAKTFNYDEFKY